MVTLQLNRWEAMLVRTALQHERVRVMKEWTELFEAPVRSGKQDVMDDIDSDIAALGRLVNELNASI